ncbi:MAG: isoleucine--tRNA ligase [Micavibrio aeruginosavorus]|uniref:Isoleucine--tRNA ligase n=1 Tax=Micavibrio aeruginosavorus TaxID=349221 RepID=A0A2W5MPZ5_9BACT|nr:MAG: isoleucine--tRNA ligase [Micavibrio aeruginosavorus]
MSNNDNTNAADKYRDTVFLPKTEFPMRGELPKKEPEMVRRWQDMDIYSKVRNVSKGRKKWILHDGPPYANGHIHLGHAVNKLLKDTINKSWQMLGYDAPYVPGWDCHGLPIEWKIEEGYRKDGRNKDEVDKITFRAECRDFAQMWVSAQGEEFQRLGVIGDWKNPYLTMTNHAESRITGEIHKFLLNGSLYRGVKPVLWSCVEKTALAEAEVEYKEHKSITCWIKFPVIKTNHAALEGANIVIWTTTPWTLPSNRAFAFGKDIDYAVYTIESVLPDSKAKAGDKLILAQKLSADVKEKAKIENWSESETFKGELVEGTVCAHPLRGKGYEFDVPGLEGDFVTDDAGTGFVHIAPSHGQDDYFLYMKHFGARDIPDNVDDEGKFRGRVPLFAGLEILNAKGEMGEGNFAVLKAMDEVGALVAKGSLRHEYPHSWRSKAPLIFRTTPQWFIAMDDDNNLRDVALQAIKETKWHPAAGQNRITAMIEQRPDWCISRQRAWGVPIALFVSKATNEPLEDEAVLKRITDAFEAEGSDVWWSKDAAYFLGNDYKVEDYEQIFDIVDVWFESGSTHVFVVDDREELHVGQSDLYLEGSDQHRGWFHSSLLESCGTKGKAPFKNVLTHGFVLDEKGYKMSKSLGNVVDPLEVMKEHGADILRLWTMTSNYSDDTRIGKDTLKTTGDLYRRIRNTLRFLLGAIDGFDGAERVPAAEFKSMPELEQYMLSRMAQLSIDIKNMIEAYDFNAVIQMLYNFCNTELSSFYFDIRKDRLYCDTPDSFERRACRTVMAELYDFLVTRLAPYIAFTAEEAWDHRPKGVFEESDSIHMRTFSTVPSEWHNIALEEKWAKILAVRSVVMGALEPHRAAKIIGSSLEANPQIFVTGEYAEAIDGNDMAEICITSQALVTRAEGPADAFRDAKTDGVSVVFRKAEGNKCVRSWKILPEVGTDKEYPDLTLRDANAVRWYNKQKEAA